MTVPRLGHAPLASKFFKFINPAVTECCAVCPKSHGGISKYRVFQKEYNGIPNVVV
jgi:hypothetical protein